MSDFIFVDATEPAYGFQVGTVLLQTHGPDECGGPLADNGKPVCCIHNQSEHHMRTWPQNWRADRGLMERICLHGVGHPDPDHMAYARRVDPETTDGVHGCDSCCVPEVAS